MPLQVKIVDTGSSWLTLIAPLAVLLAGVLAFVIGLRSLRAQRSLLSHLRAQHDEEKISRNSSEWWSRTAWALDQAASGDASKRELGIRLLAELADSELATAEDRRIVLVFTEQRLSDRGGEDDA